MPDYLFDSPEGLTHYDGDGCSEPHGRTDMDLSVKLARRGQLSGEGLVNLLMPLMPTVWPPAIPMVEYPDDDPASLLRCALNCYNRYIDGAMEFDAGMYAGCLALAAQETNSG